MEIFGLTESTIRLAVFLAIFGTMAVFELWCPRLDRPEFHGALKSKRWITNIAILLVSSVILRIAFPAAAVGVAIWANGNGFGLFSIIALPPAIAGILCFLILDFAVWLEHFASHRWKWLWRIHRVHHSDMGFDVTTALRFHPLEIVVSMVWKAAVVAILGAPILAVLIFEIVLNGSAMFNHANVKLPDYVDRTLRAVIVTPDLHRTHHSQNVAETDSNFGFNFSFWDRLFGLYVAEPANGKERLAIGLKEYDQADTSKLSWTLKLPFTK